MKVRTATPPPESDLGANYHDRQCLIPVVMAGIIAVYSLVIAVLLASDINPPSSGSYSPFKYVKRWPARLYILSTVDSGFMHLAAGLSVGLTGLGAGWAIGLVGDQVSPSARGDGRASLTGVQGVRSYMQQSRAFVGMVLILIFAEVLGLYGYVTSRTPTIRMLMLHRLIVGLILNTRTSA